MYQYVRNERSAAMRADETDDIVVVRRVEAAAPVDWLRAGWSDLQACGYRSLVYGVFFVLMGLGIEQAHSGNPAVALGLSVAFLFVGPFLSMGIYELSRQCRGEETADLLLSLFSWCRNPAAVGRFAFFLSAVLVIWLWLSTRLLDGISEGVSLPIVVTALLWCALAFVVLLSSALAIPMLLDRPVSAAMAVRTSIRGFCVNPRVMALWYGIVASMVIVSLTLHYWPLLLLGPWLGHATWHAYQQSVTPPSLSGGGGSSQ